jgi:lysozyme
LNINKEGEQLIKKYEGCKLKAYRCPSNRWTIGWGNTTYESGEPVKEGQTITQERADRLFNAMLHRFEAEVKHLLRVQLNDNHFSALVSLTWNIGSGNLKSSTLLKLINQGDYDKAAEEFDKWKYANKKVLKGLVKRRAEEKALFTLDL